MILKINSEYIYRTASFLHGSKTKWECFFGRHSHSKKQMDKVHKILEKIIEENNLSIWQLSKELKIPYMTVYHWIKHWQVPRLEYIKRICETFGINISRFF